MELTCPIYHKPGRFYKHARFIVAKWLNFKLNANSFSIPIGTKMFSENKITDIVTVRIQFKVLVKDNEFY